MNAPPKLSTNELIRARDGDACWLCGGKLNFAAEPNSKKAPTREHLLAVSMGGTNKLSNLVLCHPGCNRQLGTRPVAEKQKMRQKRLASRAKQNVVKKAGALTAAPEDPSPPKLTACPEDARVQKLALPRSDDLLTRWQMAAITAGGAALLFIGFSFGLLVG